jgi:phosphonate transport system ATP-binding protein
MVHTLEIKGLVKEYRPGQPVLKGVDLAVDGEGLTAVIGPSGTGKSTLIRCINRLVEPTHGQIWLRADGRCVDLAALRGRALRESRCWIGMVFQEFNLVERLTVMENVLTGRLGHVGAWNAWRRKFPEEDIEYAFELLETVGLSSHAHQRADALSGGQRQRVGIARALMQRPRVLLADEPTSSLDPKTSVEIMTLLKEQGRVHRIPVIVNMHDVELGKRFADRMVGMTEGSIVYDGTAAGVDNGVLKHIYGGEGWMQ